jgi:endonuclease/exonuclease/phosphatase family metal-dependent hydrolase
VLTYNVAGLPEGLSASRPARNMPLIGPLLDGYDLALVQEDFAYHAELARASGHTYRLPSELGAGGGGRIGNESGLARFSRLEPRAHERRAWSACHGVSEDGSDCLAPKGFEVAEHRVAVAGGEAILDVYNVHLDAGDGVADEAARRAQLLELAHVVAARSVGKAVLVAGDTNVSEPGALAPLRALGLADACVALGCPEPERIDRVLYRSSAWVELGAVAWWIPEEFVDPDGAPLSDHLPVAVTFDVVLTPTVGLGP